MLYPQPDVLPPYRSLHHDPVAATALVDANSSAATRPRASPTSGAWTRAAAISTPTPTARPLHATAQEYFLDNDGDGSGSSSGYVMHASHPVPAPG